ncbi:diacylglycerol kinase theta-like [Gigantopelta aegis]|uniref:diacylglycerol kinase theta-like n=1 Tax=Gigantopelta aegis TaxID=1735272 RepID=UPI001B8878C7|nr:diacylglycerol kinase theta-like [Gigantopelta aegis]
MADDTDRGESPSGGSLSELDNHHEGHGHFFTKKTFHKPTYCHHCTDIMWGLIGQGYVCEVCNFVVHDRCLRTVVSACSSVASSLIKNPVAHCWSEPGHFKRKFCNVCRKRLEDSPAIHCEICEYYAHLDCQDFVVSDCKECATYQPQREKASVIHYHHWREGNLPPNSKCVACKKTCWSSECLAGMRCEWCGVTAHAQCYRSLPVECKFGSLRDIMLPPSCLTVPRMDVPVETILGLNLTKSDTAQPDGFTFDNFTTVRYSSTSANALSHDWGCRSLPTRPSLNNMLTCCNPARHFNDGFVGRHFHFIQNAFLVGAVSFHREIFVYFLNKDTFLYWHARTVSEEWSSSGDSKNDDEEKERRSPRDKEGKDKDKDTDMEIIRVFDGNASLRRRLYRTISVPRNAAAQTILEAALKTFHISDDPKNYYVAEASDGGERELEETSPIRSQLKTPDGKRPSIFLRYREKNPDKGYMKIYPGGLRYSIFHQATPSGYKNISVHRDMTAEEVIKKASRKFGLEEKYTDNFDLVEVLLDRGVTERTLAHDEKPWELIQQSRKESLRQNRMTRFYLQQKEDPHGPSISLYLGNLPTGLSQRQYEKILLEIIGKDLKWTHFDVIYYEYGSLVLVYTSPDKATQVFNILKDAVFDDKQLLVMLLPNIQPHMIPENKNPLLVFVNVKSGGCQGLELITSFRKLLNPHQVFNLENGGPLPGLYVFRNIPYYKILVCGGDGTVGWVLSCLDNVGQDGVCSSPPMAIVPLGTGNDLARVLRWGPGYTGGEDPLNLLRDVIDAEEIKLDRWTVIFHPNEKETDEAKIAIANNTNTANTSEDTTSIFVMNNYFGIGIDADLCLDFHMAREEKPDKFNSRLHNKGVYIKMGLRKMVNRKSCKDLHRHIKIEVDGKPLDLPQVEGIIILNILSWGSGANPWGPEKEDNFSKPTHYDGMLEIVGVTGVVHMGQIHSGLRQAMRIAQGGHLRITLLTDIAVQVDGEPWIQPAGQVVVLRSALKATMLKKSKNKIKRRNTEPSIFFPECEPLKAQSPSDESGPL